jgi:shikimate dehydrogenase
MKFGLIGYPLGHSFSKEYFTRKFEHLGLSDFTYDLYPAATIDALPAILRSDVFGWNVTIPYKTAIISYLNELDDQALEIGAVNTIVRTGLNSWKGFNTDTNGFKASLVSWIGLSDIPARALVLGSGGSAKAVLYALNVLGIKSTVVSRKENGYPGYADLTKEIIADHPLIINTTPVGMSPDLYSCPDIPYQYLTTQHWVYDLIYNPANTLFLRQSEQMGAKTKNGLDMLHLQADYAWDIWKNYGRF